jgi:hypothetical protein
METFFLWIILSFAVGFVGKGRKVGYGGAFLFSLILSPVIGLIIALISKEEGGEEYRQQVLETQRQQAESLRNLEARQQIEPTQKPEPTLPADPEARANRLKDLRDRGVITQDEFLDLISRS